MSRLPTSLLLIGAATAQQQCGTVTNGGFEDGDLAANLDRGSYGFITPGMLPGWEVSVTGIMGIQQGSGPWQAPNSNGGEMMIAIQKYCSGGFPTPCAVHGQMSTTVTELEPGVTYHISYKTQARRSNAGSARLTVVLGTESLVDQLTPEADFTTVTHEFVANTSSVRVTFFNSSPQNGRTDATLFVDDVTVCPTSPITSSTTTSATATTTTVTATTHTAFDNVHRALNTIIASVDALDRRVQTIENRAVGPSQAAFDALSLRVDAASSTATATTEAIARIQRVVSGAVQNLPIPSAVSVPSCQSTGGCTPKIAATGNDVSIDSPLGDVTINTGGCGSFSPCDLLAALNDLRGIVQ